MKQNDKVFLEIFKNRIQGITEEMANVVLRTGFTAFVKETGDFGTYLLSPSGETFGSPLDTGYNLSLGIPVEAVLNQISDWQEGDIVIANDPYTTGGMSTHLPDIYLLKPYFWEKEIVAFGLSFIHSSDVGGKVPGSISPSCYDVYQEGFRLPPVKLYVAGVLNEQILHLFLTNCRIPEQNKGDLHALMAGLFRGELRVKELINRYGLEPITKGIQHLLDYAEERVQTLIKEIPNGRYSFWDYLEAGPGGYPLRLRCDLCIQDGDIFLDFTGTDPQVRASFNIPTNNAQGHYMIVPALIRYFRTIDPAIPWNAGMIRRIKNNIPQGTLLNPKSPAAVGTRAATFIRLMDVLTGALCQARPEQIPAAGAGQACIIMLSTTDVVTGVPKVGVIQPICGGSGARPMKDGIDGMDFAVGHLRNIPIEIVESDMPVLVKQYGLRPSSGGAGKYRGGCGNVLELEILSPDTILTARNMERLEFQPWGRLGGNPGKTGQVIENEHTPRYKKLGRIDELLLQPGETLSFSSPGGGGYGNPYERDVAAVLQDVCNGIISMQDAYKFYGVVIDENLQIHKQETQILRKRQTEMNRPFCYGTRRNQFESIWTDQMQNAIVEAVMRYPMSMRDYLRRNAMHAIEEMITHKQCAHPSDIVTIMQQVYENIKTYETEVKV